MVQRKSESSANVNNTGDDFNQVPVTKYTYMAWVDSLKAKRGFEVDFFKKCVPGVHAWLYIFPKHDLVI